MNPNILHYETLFELTQDVIVILSAEGFLQKVNAQWTKILGYSISESIDTPFLNFIDENDKLSTQQLLQEPNIETIRFANKCIGKKGHPIEFSWSFSIKNDTDCIIGIGQNKTEISKLTQLNKTIFRTLQTKDRQIRDYVHIASHNLRAPVSNISALVNFLKDSKLKPEQKEYVQHIQNSTIALNSTIEDLTNTIQLNSPKHLKIQEVSLEKTYHNVLKQLNEEIENNNVLVTSDFNEIQHIKYSEIYMHNIFLNLISNAIRYRSADRKPIIHIISKRMRNSIQLIFEDNGRGIDLDKYRNKIFGFRKTFHRNPDAKGLGLFITKSQVEALNGRISVTSKLEKGTTFTIDIVS